MWAVWFISMDRTSGYRPLSGNAMIEVSASLFCGSCFLVKLEHKTEEMNGQLRLTCDVQRFARQGYAGNGVST